MFRAPIRRACTAALAVLLIFAGTVSAEPAASSARNPLPLVGSVDGSLVGNGGGAYAFYQFIYPGDGSTISLTLTTNNATPLNSGAAGVNVYQGSTTAAAGRDGPFTDLALFSSTTPGPVLVQVFDYDPANNIAFTLTPKGLPARSTTATTVATASTSVVVSACRDAAIAAVINRTPMPKNTTTEGGASPDNPLPLAFETGQVSLLGKSNGAYIYYRSSALPPLSVGTYAERTFSLSTDSFDFVERGQVGLEVYYEERPLPGSLHGNPLLPETISADGTVTVAAQVRNAAPLLGSKLLLGPLLLQVFNCDAARTVHFNLSELLAVVSPDLGPGPG